MTEGLVKVAIDREKASSILKMAEVTLELAKTIDADKYPSNLTKEYYDVIRNLISAILLLDGYTAHGEGAHRTAIEYLHKNYKQFTMQEITAIDDLRITRNKIAYDGFFIQPAYIIRKRETIESIAKKLAAAVRSRL
jgi:hypothetical protein